MILESCEIALIKASFIAKSGENMPRKNEIMKLFLRTPPVPNAERPDNSVSGPETAR